MIFRAMGTGLAMRSEGLDQFSSVSSLRSTLRVPFLQGRFPNCHVSVTQLVGVMLPSNNRDENRWLVIATFCSQLAHSPRNG